MPIEWRRCIFSRVFVFSQQILNRQTCYIVIPNHNKRMSVGINREAIILICFFFFRTISFPWHEMRTKCGGMKLMVCISKLNFYCRAQCHPLSTHHSIEMKKCPLCHCSLIYLFYIFSFTIVQSLMLDHCY